LEISPEGQVNVAPKQLISPDHPSLLLFDGPQNRSNAFT
jgi:hypothetical protein